MSHNDRAMLYNLLAELLSEPPEWMISSGKDWPLLRSLSGMASDSEAVRLHAEELAAVLPETLDQRRKRYTSIFALGKPWLWLYESAIKTGKILGSPTFEMSQLLHSAGLEVDGAELPDHISLELAFLGWLASQSEDSSYEQKFLKKHGDWMIDLGRALEETNDPVYAPIGALLADWLAEQLQRDVLDKENVRFELLVPIIAYPEECTLCGFCTQVCPTHALNMTEDTESSQLRLDIADCNHCGKCERICKFYAIKMDHASYKIGEVVILRQSPLLNCQTCGHEIASVAELDYIVSKIGDANWQHFCPECRPVLYF